MGSTTVITPSKLIVEMWHQEIQQLKQQKCSNQEGKFQGMFGTFFADAKYSTKNTASYGSTKNIRYTDKWAIFEEERQF